MQEAYNHSLNQKGESVPLPEIPLASDMPPPRTRVVAKRSGSTGAEGDPLSKFEIPGSPFERGVVEPPLFYQGEDIVFEAFLYDFGKPITAGDFDITVIVKAAVRALLPTWTGVIDNGLYKNSANPGYYEIWIPSDATARWPAGQYFMDIVAKDRIGDGEARRSCTAILHTEIFALEYSAYSSYPDSSSSAGDKLSRGGIEPTWPNKPNTIGA